MRLRLCLSVLSLLCVSLAITTQAYADIVVSFSQSTPNSLSVGGSGTVDVFVRTNTGTESLDGFTLQVGLTPNGGSPSGGLVFSNSQSEAQLGISGANGYVFFGNSLAENTALPIGAVTNAGSTFTGFDATNDFVPFNLTTTNRLIYRLDLSAIAAGTFDITANLFADSFFSDQLDPSNTSILASTGTRTLTVHEATAVPEPSSMVLFALGSGAVGFYRMRRQRRAKVSPKKSTDV